MPSKETEALHSPSLASRVWDVVVVGGGITGAGIARDAAFRGLSVALIEQGDFASGTSSKSGKLVHGGFRYLKYFHLGLVAESCRERDHLLKIVAPHIVRPQRFIYPFYPWSPTPPWMARAGVALYDLLSLYRTPGTHRAHSSQKTHEQVPVLKSEGLRSSIEYWDAAALDSRLVIDTLKSVEKAGGSVANYHRLEQIEWAPSNPYGARVQLKVTPTLPHSSVSSSVSSSQTLLARSIVIASGAWTDQVLNRSPIRHRFGLTLTSGIHLAFKYDRIPLPHAVIVEVPENKRHMYAVPWGDRVLVGTTDERFHGTPESAPLKQETVDYVLRNLNAVLAPSQGPLTRADIEAVWIGVRPLIGSKEGMNEDKIPRDYEIHDDPRGVVAITGGKLTTYRSMAKHTLDHVMKLFFPHHPKARVSDRHTLKPLLESNAPRNEEPRYHPSIPLTPSQVKRFVLEEHAMTLEDIVARRSDLLLLRTHDLQLQPQVLLAIAQTAGELLGWDAIRLTQEVAHVQNEINAQMAYRGPHQS